jgi:opacity protein-like surface antigen
MGSCAVRFAASLALFAALAPSARADDPPVAPDKDKARYEIAAYIWGTSLALKLNTDRGEISEHVSFQDLIKNMSGGLMAHARGEWDTESGTWSADLDALWAKLRAPNQSKNVQLGPRGGIAIGAEAKTSLSEWVVQATGGYRLFQLGSLFSRSPTDTRHVTGEAFAGARYWSLNPNVHLAASLNGNARSIRLGDHTEWVDPVIGLRFGIDLSKTVVLGIGGDVGGFNIGNYCSEFTWSQNTMLSWAFADSWSAYAGYRFLDFHRDSGSANIRMQMRGPYIALGYRF